MGGAGGRGRRGGRRGKGGGATREGLRGQRQGEVGFTVLICSGWRTATGTLGWSGTAFTSSRPLACARCADLPFTRPSRPHAPPARLQGEMAVLDLLNPAAGECGRAGGREGARAARGPGSAARAGAVG